MAFIDKINSTHLDVLKEIGNIGAGNSATALSKLLKKKIDMKVPDVKVVSYDEMMDLVGGPENVVAGIFLRIEGDAPGSMFFVLSVTQATRFIQKLIGDTSFSFDLPPYSTLALSALEEIGNILSGSYLSSLADFANLNLYPSVPAISIDMAGAILPYGLIELSRVTDYAIVIDTSFHEDDQGNDDSIKGHFFLLPDPNSFETLFQALGVK